MVPACSADLQIGGDFVGEVRGPVHSTNRHTPSDPRGVVMEAILTVDGAPGATSFHLGIIDVDGPGPKPVIILFRQEEPEFRLADGWEAGRDAGTATIADDASAATINVAFPMADLSGGTPDVRYTLTAALSCPALPPDAEGSS